MKSTLKRAVVTLAVIGLLVVVPSMCGTWTQLSKQGRSVWHDVGVGMGLIAEPQPVSLSVSIKPDGSCTTNDKEWDPPVAVKTQVYDTAQTVSGRLRIFNQEVGSSLDLPTKYAMVSAGGSCQLKIEDITLDGWSGANPQPSPPPGARVVAVQLVVSGGFMANTEAHEFVYLEGSGPWSVSRNYSITVTGQRLKRTETTNYGTGRSGKPVYAKEVSETDAWESIHPMSWEVSFGDLSVSGQQVWNEGMGIWEPDMLSPVTGLEYTISQHSGVSGVSYSDLTVEWSACDVSFDGRQYTGSPLRLTGEGNQITVEAIANFSGFTPAGHVVTIARPYLPDFSEFAVVDRGGELIDTLRIEGGFKVDKRHAWTLPYGDPGTTIYPTVAEIRAIGQYSTPPGVTGLPYIDTDYEHQLWTPPLSFAINAASARAHKLI